MHRCVCWLAMDVVLQMNYSPAGWVVILHMEVVWSVCVPPRRVVSMASGSGDSSDLVVD
jgi:hypothetical protein